jgi:hypothetical protein
MKARPGTLSSALNTEAVYVNCTCKEVTVLTAASSKTDHLVRHLAASRKLTRYLLRNDADAEDVVQEARGPYGTAEVRTPQRVRGGGC